MEFFRLTAAQDTYFTEAFALYEESFPRHEQRLFSEQAALMKNPLYHFNVILEKGVFVGILLYWEGSGYAYIEHFAMHPSVRGKSKGSESLAQFCESHAPVVLEIDPPVDGLSARRERFYQRLGFVTNGYAHKHPAYQKEFLPHTLVLMSFPRPMDENEYQLFREELENVVMK